MGPNNLSTLTTAFVRFRHTTSTDANHPTRIPTITKPTGIGDAAAQTTSAVFDLGPTENDHASEKNRIILVPFGTGSDTNTLLMRVIGWRQCFNRNVGRREDNSLWIPVNLGEFTCTLSTAVGIAGKVVVATEIFCDTIALLSTSGNDDVDISITSPADNTIAHVAVDLKGFQLVEVTFGRNGSATGANALVAWY